MKLMDLSKRQNKGFTLIEILVVISIIAILSSIMLIGGRNYQKRAHNGKRKSDMAKFKSGMEGFYAQNKFYPNPGENNALGTGIDIEQFPACSPAIGGTAPAGNNIAIKGFTSVNECLNFLGYMVKLSPDVLEAGNSEYRYRYAILSDTVSWEASAQMEITGENDLTEDCTVSGGQCDPLRYEIGPAVGAVDTSDTYYCFTADGSGCLGPIPSPPSYSTTD